MVKKILIIILISGKFLFAQTSHDFFEKGTSAYKKSNYSVALKYFEQSADLYKKEGNEKYYGYSLNWIGLVYNSWGEYDKALEYYHTTLAIDEKLEYKEGIARDFNNIGMVYLARGGFDKAVEYFNKSLALSKELDLKNGISLSFNNIGSVYHAWGQYDKAIHYYNLALAINKELGKKSVIAVLLNNIGFVYKAWGHYEKAIQYYHKAIAIKEELGEKDDIDTVLNNIGSVYNIWKRYGDAIDYFKKALAMNKKLGKKEGIAAYLNNLGHVYDSLGQIDKALAYYEKALCIHEELKRKDNIGISLNNIGAIYYKWKQYGKALEYFTRALDIHEELGRKEAVANLLSNIGIVYHTLQKYSKSIEKLKKSIEIIEQLRLTAPGEIKRDYISQEISTYQWLVSSYIRNGDYYSAMNTVDISCAKYLIDLFSKKFHDASLTFTDIKYYQKKIAVNSVILSVSNIELNTGIAAIITDNKSIHAVEKDKTQFIKNITDKYSKNITTLYAKYRGFQIKPEKKDLIEKDQVNDFNKIINYYRYLLSLQYPGHEETSALKFISGELYNLLFNNIEKHFIGKDELIIMPEGIMALIPFESLIMPDGKYLIEKYHIKYIQSLTVKKIIDDRYFPDSRKSMIAFGGGIYDENTYKTDMVESDLQMAYLKKEALLSISRGQSTRNVYASLGYSKWSNLPGTLTEVKAIKSFINNVDLYTGEDVDESLIKSLSKKGILKTYKVIHFAAHGLSFQDIPDLSAIVLSQFKKERNGEDGYLNMQEITDLDINADFVNLSACETGLGKIYGGEGVVGLTQSFLLAGANGLSVSLWQVADKSTMEFMIGVYKKAIKQKISYDLALTEMKREFIKNTYSLPFYWAPFVYYGK